MVMREMVARDVPVRQVARDLGVDESTLRYHLARADVAPDGRRDRQSVVDGWEARIAAVLARFADPRVGGEAMDRVEAWVVHGVLRREFAFAGSYQAVRRYLERAFPASAVRAVRRVETPAGVQAQHDWFDVGVRIGGARQPLRGLIGTLSHSRARLVWMSPTMHQLAWQSGGDPSGLRRDLHPLLGTIPSPPRLNFLSRVEGIGILIALYTLPDMSRRC